jgi:hypothetical protein
MPRRGTRARWSANRTKQRPGIVAPRNSRLVRRLVRSPDQSAAVARVCGARIGRGSLVGPSAGPISGCGSRSAAPASSVVRSLVRQPDQSAAVGPGLRRGSRIVRPLVRQADHSRALQSGAAIRSRGQPSRIASTESATLPFSAREIGQPSFPFSAASRKLSAVAPGTVPRTVIAAAMTVQPASSLSALTST